MTQPIKTRILHVSQHTPELMPIQIAAQTILNGGLVAFPTETVYGLGANALNSEAIARIYAAKNRPFSDPLIVHISDVSQLDQLAVNIPDAARQLAAAFWPGALTLVLERADHVPQAIATGRKTVAVRLPAHAIAHALIATAGTPIAAPSANTFTRPSATTAQHVLEDLNGRIDIVLDGGSATIGLESTVIDMTQTPPVVLRPGGVLMDDIRRIVPNVQIRSQYLNEDDAGSASPGMLLKHYSPRARLMLFDGATEVVRVAICDTAQRLISNQKKVGILALDEDAEHFTKLGARIIALGGSNDLNAIARRLFGALRALDAQHVDVILVRGFGKDGLGTAIWDRLVRAAEGRIISV